MAENFSIEHSRTKITEVKKTIEDKKQPLFFWIHIVRLL